MTIRSRAARSLFLLLPLLAILFSSSTSAQTKVNPNQIGPGTLSSAITTTGNNTHSGTENFTGQVTAGNSTNTVSGVFTCSSINTVICADQQAGATADAKISAAITALPSTGGTVDARGFGATTQTIASTVTIGSSTKLVTLLMDRATFFQCTITNNTSCWTVCPGSGMVVAGPGEGIGTTFGFGVSNSASISNVVLSSSCGVATADRPLLDHIYIVGNTSATVSDAVVDLGNLLDGSSINNLGIAGYTNTYLLKLSNANGSIGPTDIQNPDISCDGVSGCKPVLITSTSNLNVVSSVNFYAGSITHPGSGGLAIVDIEGTNGQGNNSGVNFFGTQFESSNTGDVGVLVNNAYGVAMYGTSFTARINSGTACLKISGASGQVIADNLTNFNTWTDTILNSATGGTTITGATQSRIEHYAYYGAGSGTAHLANVFEDQNGREAVIDDNGISGLNINAKTAFQANGVAGFTGSKVAGACTLTISEGIITNVTGC